MLGVFHDYRPTADFVRAFLPDPPCRVLEIGCGAGELALTLRAEGCNLIAIDPDAPEGPPFRKTTLEAFSDPQPFACVIAMRVLHHIHDLDGAVNKIAGMLVPGGPLILEDFGWNLMDDRTLAWYFERQQALGRGPRGSPVPASLEACRETWRTEHAGLHESGPMFDSLAAHFDRRMFAWTQYLAHLLKDTEGNDREIEALVTEEINPIAFRYVGFAKR
jgi:SAM-dependent methyltransferase